MFDKFKVLKSKIVKTSYHSWKNNEIHMFLAKSWFSLAKKCEKDLKIQFFKLNCITFITKLSQCTFLFSKVETFKFKSWIYACWANSWIRVTVEPKPGRPYPSDWQPHLSVCLSVTLSRSSPLWSARAKKLSRKREKTWKSSANEETVEKSREKWFGHGSIPNPSDYRKLRVHLLDPVHRRL